MSKYILDFWLDGYEDEKDRTEAEIEFIKDQLDMSASSVKVKDISQALNWERIWEQFKLQGIRFEHKNFLKELIEKQLKDGSD
jgi:hypothetical protein